MTVLAVIGYLILSLAFLGAVTMTGLLVLYAVDNRREAAAFDAEWAALDKAVNG